MTVLGLMLVFLAGGSLGLFGAGGSILLVPVLVYVLRIPPRDAMATSLLVLFVTSGAALLAPSVRAHIRWRSSAVLGLAAMASAYAGGRIAEHVPVGFLLTAFALLTMVAAIAMLRARPGEVAAETAEGDREPLGRSLLSVGAIGFMVGLVGAGGGFLVVPALLLFAKLPLRKAMATSLLVVSLQSLAGLIGHAHHLELDVPLTAAIAAFAVAGGAVGARLAVRVPAARLRRAFAWFLAAAGAALLAAQIPAAWLAQAAAGLAPFAPALGGVVLGLAAALLWLLNGRIAGVSGIAGGTLRLAGGDRGWRVAFLLGLMLGGLAMSRLIPGAFETLATPTGMIVAAGLMVGIGSTLANGCTSGHGVCGVSRLSSRSLAAVGTFMATGMVTVFVVRHVLGGQP